MPFQAQITEIENGFLVALPPEESAIVMAARQGQQPNGRVHFCKDFDEVSAVLKNNWPVKIV